MEENVELDEIEGDEEESFEEFDENFDPDIEEEEEGEEFVTDKPSKDNKYIDSSVEGAVRVNPKRQQARKKAVSLIGGVDLSGTEGQSKAWTKLSSSIDTSTPIPYSMTSAFKEGDFISHVKFGQGFVVELLSDTKMAVLFEEGLKKLVCKKA